ncbi:hypothetical protein ABMA27_005233 [Loxostege sticticalis]|uniref:Insulin receptor substrate 1 n=1 Tax=Loxostege sticticalis TaxID=481309 RepID=A0ABR3HM89_LOXSC
MSAGAGGGGAGAVVRHGHLRKLKTMKKKYFVLRAETQECSARLEYYESEKKFRSGASPRRVLPLKSCYNITRRLDLKQKHVIALFTREEQFCIVAENEQDLHAWLTAILKQHRSDDASEELLHPIQHVWQVNVQKKGLGSTKNIQGLYNLCLTDKTLTLVKIKSHNNVISDLGIPERIEYSLKNIRRCGDSECFFYMEVGRQTSTGAGELWMHSDDSNIAQSMHSTIYLAMRNCAKDTENERDHIILPGEGPMLGQRSHSYSDTKHGRAGLSNAENQPPNNSLTSDNPDKGGRVIKHHRTVSLPTGCALFHEPLRVSHERTRSAPLAGAHDDLLAPARPSEPDLERLAHARPAEPKKAWSRRASTGARLNKLSPAHSKNAGPRSRCDSMPSRVISSYEVERPPPRLNDLDCVEVSRDEPDALAEWCRTPRIPEEPDCCDVSRDFISSGGRVGGPIPPGASIQHSRTSSFGADDCVPDGYLPMAPGHDPLPALVSASSGSVCSGTPSTDPRFSEYQLEPAMSHIVEGERPPRAWSVGSRGALGAAAANSAGARERHRAYSVGARCRPTHHPPHPKAPASAPLLPRASAEDLMELDFSANSPQAKVAISRTPPTGGFERARPNTDEYVDMSPRNASFVSRRSPPLTPAPAPAPLHTPAPVPDGYVEMNYTRAPTRPIAIAARAPVPVTPVAAAPGPAASPPRRMAARTPLGSQTIFPLSLDSPASPPDLDAADVFDDDAKEEPSHPLTTVREISEEGPREPRRSPTGSSVSLLGSDMASSPQYVRLALAANPRPLLPPHSRVPDADSTATVVVAGAHGAAPARFSVGGSPPATPPPTPTAGGHEPLNYAALDLQPRRAPQPHQPRTYTQIDFVRSEKLHAADAT